MASVDVPWLNKLGWYEAQKEGQRAGTVSAQGGRFQMTAEWWKPS